MRRNHIRLICIMDHGKETLPHRADGCNIPYVREVVRLSVHRRTMRSEEGGGVRSGLRCLLKRVHYTLLMPYAPSTVDAQTSVPSGSRISMGGGRGACARVNRTDVQRRIMSDKAPTFGPEVIQITPATGTSHNCRSRSRPRCHSMWGGRIGPVSASNKNRAENRVSYAAPSHRNFRGDAPRDGRRTVLPLGQHSKPASAAIRYGFMIGTIG